MRRQISDRVFEHVARRTLNTQTIDLHKYILSSHLSYFMNMTPLGCWTAIEMGICFSMCSIMEHNGDAVKPNSGIHTYGKAPRAKQRRHNRPRPIQILGPPATTRRAYKPPRPPTPHPHSHRHSSRVSSKSLPPRIITISHVAQSPRIVEIERRKPTQRMHHGKRATMRGNVKVAGRPRPENLHDEEVLSRIIRQNNAISRRNNPTPIPRRVQFIKDSDRR